MWVSVKETETHLEAVDRDVSTWCFCFVAALPALDLVIPCQLLSIENYYLRLGIIPEYSVRIKRIFHLRTVII